MSFVFTSSDSSLSTDPDHRIMLYAGRDATEEFLMVHEASVIQKYAKQYIVGSLKA